VRFEPKRRLAGPAKVVLYSHALLGVGHVRRSALLAQALQRDFSAECWLLACRRGVQGSVVPTGLKTVQLPNWPASGEKVAGAVCRQRIEIIDDLVGSVDPDVVLVDHLFLGLGGELSRLLAAAPRGPAATRFVIGLPYGPAASAEGPRNRRIRELMARYDAALCYTDERYERPADAFANKNFPMPAERHYVGYVISSARLRARPPPDCPVVVALAGGGSTGATLFGLVMSALDDDLEARRVRLRLVLGPLFSQRAMLDMQRKANVEVVAESSLEDAVQGASVVVSRCGYNNAYALLTSSLPTIFCPFSAATSDQPARAEALSAFDRVWNLFESDGPDAMRAAIQAAIAAGPYSRTGAIDCDGASAGAAELVRIADGRA